MKNIVVLVSGGGTNLQALIDAEKRGEIKGGHITCVISSKPDAYALERAAQNGISTRIIPRKEYADVASYTKAITEALLEENADLVVYAGFMTILDEQVVRAFPYRMMNVHPALIPSFCGKGFYGLRVHEAVLESGVKLTGATVHFVTEVCDGGPIILQGAVPVMNGDTPERLQKRVMEQAEWKLLPKAVSLFCEDRIKIKDGKAYVLEGPEIIDERQLVSRGVLTWKLFGRKIPVLTAKTVTPEYAKKCARELNSLSEDAINSLCCGAKKYCLWYAANMCREINSFMSVPISEDTPPKEILADITPKRLAITADGEGFCVGFDCDWENREGLSTRYGMCAAILDGKVVFVGTDMIFSPNDIRFGALMNWADGFENYD